MNHSKMKILGRILAVTIFIIYLAYLFYRVFFFAYGQYFRSYQNEISYNIVPLKTIIGYLINIKNYKPSIWFFNLFGNVLAFIPVGFLLPLISAKLKNIKRIAAVSFIFSTMIEISQFYLRLGISDIDDVILNTFGGVMGYLWLQKIFNLWDKQRLSSEKWRTKYNAKDRT